MDLNRPLITEVTNVDNAASLCFKSNPPETWKWNICLCPLWFLGLLIRYLILFPLRIVVLIIGWVLFLACYIPVHVVLQGHDQLRKKLERVMVRIMCRVFVASWSGIVRYHGEGPGNRPKQVLVANHTTMIDFIVLGQVTAFAATMQKHPGWVGLLQSTVLESIGCIWFNRAEAADRKIVARKLREHVEGDDNEVPILIFPEGTCVNNEYSLMFRKSAFELGCTVCPVAIKYNNIFVDAFWNSSKQSFTRYLLTLMTSWALICDVYYLEPQILQLGETSIEFAERVKHMISEKAGLKMLPWDGYYLKYVHPSTKHDKDIVDRDIAV